MVHADADTVQFYNTNAQEYAESILSADVSHQLQGFLQRIPAGGRILDAGCGTGRDSVLMLRQGYHVELFDASKSMASISSANTGLSVTVESFESIQLKDNWYDGIWCMASLVHVQRDNMRDVLLKLFNSLKNDSIMFCSYKKGDDFKQNGRRFTCYNEQEIKELLESIGFTIIDMETVNDSRDDNSTQWINFFVQKKRAFG